MKMEQITFADLLRDERAFMTPAQGIKAEKLHSIPQTKIQLRETGMRYDIPQITNRKELSNFFLKLNENEAFEKFSILSVSSRCTPIAIYSIHGSLSEVSAYPRLVVTFALLSNAHSVFLAHNHPGGTCAPSPEDIKSTIELKRALAFVGIGVLDHMITTPEGETYSMAQHGDVDFCR